MKPVTQYLTAVFELRPSRRKAAEVEHVRVAADGSADFSSAEMRAGDSKAGALFKKAASLALSKGTISIYR